MKKPPVLIRIEKQRKVARIIRSCLQPYGLAEAVQENDLQVHKKYIAENTGSSPSLSNTILSEMFPHHEPVPAELYHYTSIENLKNIAACNELRLYAVRKRIDEGELKTFAEAHALDGYLDNTHGPPFYKELSDNLFYISLTRIAPSNATSAAAMWAIFAKGNGVCLKLRISPKAAELRAIQYEQHSRRTVLQEINEALKAEGMPPFVPWTISRIGAYYLSSTMQDEDEVRVLIKRYEGGPNPVRSDGINDYWPVTIGAGNNVCDVEMIGITPGPSADESTIRATIANTQVADVPIT